MTNDELQAYANNPSRVINKVISDIEEAYSSKGFTLNSKSHPFVYAIDFIAGNTYNLLTRNSDNLSQLYPFHASNLSDLSRFMSDEDWYGMFATPSSTTLRYAINVEEIDKYAITFEETSGTVINKYKKLVIPKDTEIDVQGLTFCVEHPIEIRVMEHGGYHVVYDSSVINPLHTLQNNILEKDFQIVNEKKYLVIKVPVRQYACTPYLNLSSTELTGFKQTIKYSDQLYAVRAFLVREQDNANIEMAVTYTDRVFDSNVATLVIDLDTTTNTLVCEIPDAYINNKLGVGQVKIFVYTTQGELEKNIKEIESVYFTASYQDWRYPNGKLGTYSTNINENIEHHWGSFNNVSGGVNARDFDEVRHATIYGNKQGEVPITDNQLTYSLESSGYSAVKVIDSVSMRLYNVTKELPVQSNKKFNAAMGCHITSYLTSVNDLVSTGVVYDNGARVTIPPNTLFNINNDTTKLIPLPELNQIKIKSNDDIVNLNNNNTLVFNPFYYVIDTTNSQAAVRTYNLDQPEFQYQTFAYENANLGVELSIGTITVKHTKEGYVIDLLTSSGDTFKELGVDLTGVQLSFTPVDSVKLASIKGQFMGYNADGEYIYRFLMKTDFDVDDNDHLYFNDFYQYGTKAGKLGCDLETDLTFIFTLDGFGTLKSSDSDNKIEKGIFTKNPVAVIESKFRIVFGSNMKWLHKRVRPVTGSAQYQKYEANVYATYADNEYKRDDSGNLVFDSAGKLILVNKKGAVIKDSSGNQVIVHSANDIVTDSTGKPVKLADRDLKYHFDLITFDGSYYFATDEYDLAFLKETKAYFVDTIMKDMSDYENRCLEATTLQFHPKIKLGRGDVIINNKYETTINKALSFVVTYYVYEDRLSDSDLTAAIEEQTPIVINNALLEGVITTTNIATLLKDMAGSDVLSVKLSALAGDSEIDVISSVDNSNGFSIEKILTNSTDGLLSISENVEINWRVHRERT